jgi:hypothetical protein
MTSENLSSFHSLVKLWNDQQDSACLHLDVRDLLEAGGEPYSIIMVQVNDLQPGGTLLIHVPFEPRPLVAQLQRMGFIAKTNNYGLDHFILTVIREDESH